MVPNELLPQFFVQAGNRSDAHPSMKVIDDKDIDVVVKVEKACATSCQGSRKITSVRPGDTSQYPSTLKAFTIQYRPEAM